MVAVDGVVVGKGSWRADSIALRAATLFGFVPVASGVIVGLRASGLCGVFQCSLSSPTNPYGRPLWSRGPVVAFCLAARGEIEVHHAEACEGGSVSHAW